MTTAQEIKNAIIRMKNAEAQKAKREAFFRKAREEFYRNEQIRLQKEAFERAKQKPTPKRNWGNRVW